MLIDEIMTKGVDEPYRMFTSRAEYRLLLRQDDADERLTGLSYEIGLAGHRRLELLNKKLEEKNQIINILKEKSISPDLINPILIKKGTTEINQKVKAIEILKRPQISIRDLMQVIPEINNITKSDRLRIKEISDSVEIAVKYSGYIDRERNMADKLKRLENIRIHEKIDYNSLKSLSTEARQKLTKQTPRTIGEASRISGVSPADVSVLLLYMGR